ncbi:MAG: hypothetical protein BRD21_02540, partial [Halobacteriales archaeon SW_8_66_22]
LEAADGAVPTSDVRNPGDCPACVPPDESFAPAVAAAAERALGTELDVEHGGESRIGGLLG